MVLFCPVVSQLSWPFSFLHASHMWHFCESPIESHSRDPVTRTSMSMSFLWKQIFYSCEQLSMLRKAYLERSCSPFGWLAKYHMTFDYSASSMCFSHNLSWVVHLWVSRKQVTNFTVLHRSSPNFYSQPLH